MLCFRLRTYGYFGSSVSGSFWISYLATGSFLLSDFECNGHLLSVLLFGFCVLHLYLSVDDSRVLTSSRPALVSWGGFRLRSCACSDYAYVLAMKLSKSTQLLCLRFVFGTLFA